MYVKGFREYEGMSVHNRVRQEMMLRIYLEGDHRIDLEGERREFMDATARKLFSEGLRFFRDMGLGNKRIISLGKDVCLIPWMGDKIVVMRNFGWKKPNCQERPTGIFRGI